MNQFAKYMVDLATGSAVEADPDVGKDPAAVKRGRAAGIKGGKARAAKMTAEQGSEAARKAVTARWSR